MSFGYKKIHVEVIVELKISCNFSYGTCTIYSTVKKLVKTVLSCFGYFLYTHFLLLKKIVKENCKLKRMLASFIGTVDCDK